MSARLDRFWAKVEKGATCWEWTGCLSPVGYGRFWADGRVNNAHRWLMAELGAELAGLDVDHICANKRCVNPAHLEAVTRAENMRRAPHAIQRRTREVCGRGHDDYAPRPDGHRECRTCARMKPSRQKVAS